MGTNDLTMKWQVKLTERKIARGIVLSGWRSLLLPVVIFGALSIFISLVAVLTVHQSSVEAFQSFVVPFLFYMVIIALTYAFSIWIIARITYKRVVRQGSSNLQAHEIKDGKLVYSAAGDEIQLTLANTSVTGQHPGVVVLKREGNRRFYLLFDSADEQARAVQILTAIHS